MFVLAVITVIRPESVAGVGLLAGAAYVWALAPRPCLHWSWSRLPG